MCNGWIGFCLLESPIYFDLKYNFDMDSVKVLENITHFFWQQLSTDDAGNYICEVKYIFY